ncbi:MAG: ParB/RepB/Spo0J family partition protein [Cyanobacteria bacterium CRU_2_1]|nr:ParB/RepB/Spo0J family partition protein [Cyanobacteria bacterium CRU_2_1]
MVKRPRIAGKPSLPPEAEQWAKQAGIDPELARIQQQASASKLPLADIKDRFGTDTRPLNQSHVLALAESIAVLGLIEPLAIDSQNRLLAGSHRRAAISLVKQEYPDAFDLQFPGGLVPVLTMPFDSETDPALALAIETAENVHRKDYTPDEVRALAERLKDAGYTSRRGKPKPGDKLLVPALEAAIGKHRRTIHRYLIDTGGNETDVTISQRKQRDKLLSSCIRYLEKWQQLTPLNRDEMQIEQAIQEFLSILSKLTK